MENKKNIFRSIRFSHLCWVGVIFLIGLFCFNQPKLLNQEFTKISYTKQFVEVSANQEGSYFSKSKKNINDSTRMLLAGSARKLENFDANLISGQINYFLGDYQAALLNYQKYLQLNPKNEVPRFLIYKTAMILGEEKIANDILERGNVQKDQLISYIRFFDFDNSNGELMPLLRKITDMDPDNPETWKLWLDAGLNYENKFQYFQALQIFYEALQVQKIYQLTHYPSSFWLNIGWIYQSGLKINNQENILNIYEKSEELGSFQNLRDESNLHLYKGWVYRSFNDKQYDDDVLKEYQLALSLQPDDYYLICETGVFYLYNLQNFNLANEYFEYALTIDSEKPNAYHLLGESYLFLNNPGMAKMYYQLAISKDGNFSPAITRLDEIQNNENE